MPNEQIVWDDSVGGNIEHLAEHGVTLEEFEQVLAAGFADRVISRSHPDHWLVQGFTDRGRFLFIVFEYFEAEHLINPVTAYEPSKRETWDE